MYSTVFRLVRNKSLDRAGVKLFFSTDAECKSVKSFENLDVDLPEQKLVALHTSIVLVYSNFLV